MVVEAKICREHALDCAIMALTAKEPPQRQIFSDLFERWTSLAIDAERTEDAEQGSLSPAPSTI
jgi:hypothetical protein